MDMDFADIAKISRHQISFTKFLGSGAFGEVYEGIANGLLSPHENTRVAIKTLRKGASNIEKLEFIQEAKLMVQFQHPHIIQLLGICVDTDPCCLLLELMGGGDLLSYLRSHRPNLGSATSLTIIDLLRMCVDVAKGCVYLEEMHFVHRDLAARNCLVQLDVISANYSNERSISGGSGTPVPSRRVVKIGDFGLARDIYRNDYYNKEGEGLLPVRWMAPESLVDGVFTGKSDVWAFGVLLWEIMTLGQQPYPARNNLEVLHYVRGGGRLHQPHHCPQPLSQLMLRCWEYNQDNRPSFRECQADLENILQSYENMLMDNPQQHHMSMSATHEALNEPEIPPEENEDEYGFSPSSVTPPVSATAQLPRRYNYRTESSPKYIEVIAEAGGGIRDLQEQATPTIPRVGVNEGYEIPLPRKPPRKRAQEGNQSFSSSIQSSHSSPAPEYGLPSPKYWNVDVPLYSSPSYFKRSNSASSNFPLLHKDGGGASSTSTLTTIETRNEAFVQDSFEDVQYTSVSCPDYHLHRHDHTGEGLPPQYHHEIVERASGETRDLRTPDSKLYSYPYGIPTQTTNFSENINYHRHHQHPPQAFNRQIVDTCGSG